MPADWQVDPQRACMTALVRKGWECRPSTISNGWLQAIHHASGDVVVGTDFKQLLNAACVKDEERRKKERRKAREG